MQFPSAPSSCQPRLALYSQTESVRFPFHAEPTTNRLYHNNRDGTFTDVSDASGVAKARGSYMMTAVSADFDNDDWPDSYVACDSTPSFLFRNHNGTFREEGLRSGVALNENGNAQAGMGIGVRSTSERKSPRCACPL